MLPLSHTYISLKVTERKDPLLLMGSVLPDITSTSKNIIERKKIHNVPYNFYDFVKEKYPEFIDLGLGFLLHCEQSKGADYYSDDFSVGYAYLNGLQVNSDVGKMIGEEPKREPFVLSHNFIEIALDLLISKDYPEIAHLYIESQDAIDKDLLVTILSDYLSLERELVKRELQKFLRVLSYENLVDREKVIDEVTVPLIKIRYGKDVDRNDALDIVDKSTKIIEDTYEDFLKHVVKEMKTTFTTFLH